MGVVEVIQQSGISTRPTAFADALRVLREKSRLSQSRLAETAGFDHSYVSRLETGSRMPTRDAVLKLADALQLPEQGRDRLIASAGFMPGQLSSLFASEPALLEAFDLLQDVNIPKEIRDDVRNMISLLVRQAQRAAAQLAAQNPPAADL